MLRQLLWVSIICVWKVNAMYDFFQRECNIPQCDVIAGYLNNHVNVGEIACDDFLEYACKYNTSKSFNGRYDDSGSQHYQRLDSFGKEKHILADIFHGILTTKIDEKSPSPALKWERSVYEKCKNRMNNRENEETYMMQLGDANRLDPKYATEYYDNKTNDFVSWIIPDRKYARKGVGFAFFNVKIIASQIDDPFMKDQSRYVQISPMSVGDPMNMLEFFSKYYKDNYDLYKHKALRKFLLDLNEITPRSTDHEESESNDGERYKISDWQEQWVLHGTDDTHLNWEPHLNSIGLQLRSDDTILVKNKVYFEHLAAKMHSTHMNAITDFVHLRYIMKTVGFVKPEYRHHAIIPEIKGLACAPGLMVGVVNNFVSKYFTLENKRLLDTMFNDLKYNIRLNLGSIGDSHDRIVVATKKFLEKLNSANVVIGYPEWVNSTDATELYSPKMVYENYFQNQLHALEMLQQRQVYSYTRARSAVFEMDMYYKALTLKDYEFDMDRNVIILPMALFNEHDYKYYSSLLFNPINYASAGTAIAQKLYYTYLAEIALYSTQNNLPRCIEDDASGLRNDKKKNYILDSTSWLLAVRDSFNTWQDKDGLPIYFKDFGAILPKQLFYIIFAQSLCKLPNAGSADGPANHINFVLANSVGFQESFRCDKRHKLYRSKDEICEPLQQYLK